MHTALITSVPNSQSTAQVRHVGARVPARKRAAIIAPLARSSPALRWNGASESLHQTTVTVRKELLDDS